MLGKIWKKILLFIVLVIILWDITIKLVQRNSLKKELEQTLNYVHTNNVIYNNTTENQTAQ